MFWLSLVLILKLDVLSSYTLYITHAHLAAHESCKQDCWAMVLCRNDAKIFGKMVRMIAMVALPCDNAHILPKKHSGTRAIFNFFRAIDNSNFYWKILSLGHFFQVVQVLFSFIFFNTLQHLFTGMIPWIVLQRNQDI